MILQCSGYLPGQHSRLSDLPVNTFWTPKYQYDRHAVSVIRRDLRAQGFDQSSGRKWFDCAECHAEQENHPLLQSFDMVSGSKAPRGRGTSLTTIKTFICKKCRKAFRKDTKDWDDRWERSREIITQAVQVLIWYSDEYCPNCDNHFVIDALTPKAALKVESDDVRIDSRYEDLQRSSSNADLYY